MPHTIIARDVEEVLQAKLDEFAGDQRRWGVAALVILQKAADYLLENLRVLDGVISLENSFVTYKYVLDWHRQVGKEQKYLAGPQISKQDLIDERRLGTEIDQYLFDQSICAVLDWLSQSPSYWIGFPNHHSDKDFVARLLTETTSSKALPEANKAEMKPRSLQDIGIPPIFLLFDSTRTPIGGIVFRFLPFVEDADTQTAYFPIEVGIVPFIEKYISKDRTQSIVDSSRTRWTATVHSILSECEDSSIALMSSTDFRPLMSFDPEQLQNLANDLNARVIQVVRSELLNVFKAHGIILFEDDVQPIPIGRLMDSLEEENTFKKVGDYWETAFQGKRTMLRDITGAHYIAFLLAYPERPFSILELDAAVRHHDIKKASSLGATSGVHDEILDEQSLKEYRNRLLELARDRSRAEQDKDETLLANIDEETQKIQDVLDPAIGLGGKSRKNNSQTERARVNITRQIKSAIKKIEKDNAALSSYLSSTIKTGYHCQYSPLPGASITWNL